MPQPLTVLLNGQPRTLDALTAPAMLDAVIAALDLKPDRVAVELNGDIVRRASWPSAVVNQNARLEIVHFVGGGI